MSFREIHQVLKVIKEGEALKNGVWQLIFVVIKLNILRNLH